MKEAVWRVGCWARFVAPRSGGITLLDHEQAIDGEVGQSLRATIRPVDFKRIGARGRAQSEMLAGIHRRHVSSVWTVVEVLRLPPRFEPQLRAEAVAARRIALECDPPNRDGLGAKLRLQAGR